EVELRQLPQDCHREYDADFVESRAAAYALARPRQLVGGDAIAAEEVPHGVRVEEHLRPGSSANHYGCDSTADEEASREADEHDLALGRQNRDRARTRNPATPRGERGRRVRM